MNEEEKQLSRILQRYILKVRGGKTVHHMGNQYIVMSNRFVYDKKFSKIEEELLSLTDGETIIWRPHSTYSVVTTLADTLRNHIAIYEHAGIEID